VASSLGRRASQYDDTGWATGVLFLAGARKGFLLFATSSRPALWPTQPPFETVKGVFSCGSRHRGAKLNTYLHLLQRLRKRGAKPPPPYVFRAWKTLLFVYSETIRHACPSCQEGMSHTSTTSSSSLSSVRSGPTVNYINFKFFSYFLIPEAQGKIKTSNPPPQKFAVINP
jgi:hypothetical protein